MTTPSGNTERRRTAQITFVIGCVGTTFVLIHNFISSGIIASVSLFSLIFFFMLLIVVFMIGALIALAYDADFFEAASAHAA